MTKWSILVNNEYASDCQYKENQLPMAMITIRFERVYTRSEVTKRSAFDRSQQSGIDAYSYIM